MVAGEQRIAQDVADLVLSVHTGRGLVGGVPFTSSEASEVNRVSLLGPARVVVRQPARQRTFSNLDARVFKEALMGIPLLEPLALLALLVLPAFWLLALTTRWGGRPPQRRRVLMGLAGARWRLRRSRWRWLARS